MTSATSALPIRNWGRFAPPSAYEQALAIAREIGDKRNEGIWNWKLALAYEQDGDRDQAIAYARVALALYEATEHPSREKARTQLRKWGVEDG